MGTTQIPGKQVKDGSIDLTVDVTGVLPRPNGGIPATFAAAGILRASTTTAAIDTVAAPTGAIVGTSDAQTLTNKTISTGCSMAASLLTGTLAAGQFPALTGAVTTTAGSLATTIATSAVTNAMLAGSIAASKLVGSDIATVGTVTSGTWNATAIAIAKVAAGSAGQIHMTNATPASAWVTPTGDVTITSAGVTAIGASKVTNSMLAGSIAASKLVGSDIATVGTITAGTWNAGAVTSSGAVTGTQFAATGTGANVLPAGTTAQRPGSPATGATRWNSTTGALEVYTGSEWSGTVHTPTLLNSWAQIATYSAPSYSKDANGIVHLRGVLNGGASGTNVFLLPAGYRTTETAVYVVANSTSDIRVQADGYVFCATQNGFISLDGISFQAQA